MGPCHVGFVQIGIGAAQVAVAQVGLLEVGFLKRCPPQVNRLQVCLLQVGTG